MIPTIDEIRAKACALAFGNPIIENTYRGFVAELIIGAALAPEWGLCSADWSGWDFEHATGCRLEVKQSAARQTWTPRRPSPPTFDIRKRTGYYVGAEWIGEGGRFAHIYVFAYHPITDESADHRDARQWQFYVIATKRLPESKTITLAKIAALADAVPCSALKTVVEDMRGTLGFSLPPSPS